MASVMPLFFFGWTVGMIGCQFNPSLHPTFLTQFLYSGVVLIGCGTYGYAFMHCVHYYPC